MSETSDLPMKKTELRRSPHKEWASTCLSIFIHELWHIALHQIPDRSCRGWFTVLFPYRLYGMAEAYSLRFASFHGVSALWNTLRVYSVLYE
jgi:hypothetical protein